jgi:hypothetical protein
MSIPESMTTYTNKGWMNLTSQMPPKVNSMEIKGSKIRKDFILPEIVELKKKIPPNISEISVRDKI